MFFFILELKQCRFTQCFPLGILGTCFLSSWHWYLTPQITLAKDPLSFENTLEATNSVVYFHPEDEHFARRISEILDYARTSVGDYYGYIDGKVTTYIYRSNEEMAAGLKRVLNFEPWEIKAILHVGISAYTQGSLHIHHRRNELKLTTVWRVVIDEYVQGVTEDRFGLQPATSATWIEEGVSSYVAYQALKQRFPDFAKEHLISRQKAAFKMLLAGQFPSFRDISTRKKWHENIYKSWVSWNSEYAAAFMGILYIVDRFGFAAVEEILTAVSRGVPYTTAMEKQLGTTLDEFETDVKFSVFFDGVFNLYSKYTMLLVILSVLALLTLLWFRRSRQRNIVVNPQN